VPPSLYDALPGSLDPVLRRVYAARQVGPEQLDASMARLLPVSGLGGVREAAVVLAEARRVQAGIVVVGDFDADGATAAALTLLALRAFGFRRASYLVPNRFELGYGLSAAAVELAAASHPQLIITVDNGISSLEGVERARELGIDVIVTDHHLPGEVLPAARIIVNPNCPGEQFGSRALCGVGVAFYVMAALARELDSRGLVAYPVARQALSACLDLVALGTVADVVRLDHNNRVLVSEGLRRIRAGRARPGLRALFAVAGRDERKASAADLAFGIAPRLNAAGRLTDMGLGIDCLLEEDPGRARELAAKLHELNAERQDLQARMQDEAEQLLCSLGDWQAGDEHAALCLFDPGWHEGIVGLLASRVREQTGRPVVALAPAVEPGMLKGSARSIEGLHIRDVLALIASRWQIDGMSFGGHAMAAGLRLPAAQLQPFQQALSAEVARQLADMEPGNVLWTDGPLEGRQLGVELAARLDAGGPWGQGFPEPLFDNVFSVLDQRLLKDAHLKLTLRHADGGSPVEAIAFRETRQLPDAVRLLYRLAINDYGGRRRHQLVVEHIQSA